MAQITFTIPDEKVTEFQDAFAWRTNWDGVTPATATENVREEIIRFAKAIHTAHQRFLIEEAGTPSTIDIT